MGGFEVVLSEKLAINEVFIPLESGENQPQHPFWSNFFLFSLHKTSFSGNYVVIFGKKLKFGGEKTGNR
jgi:hypothetical protein